MPHPSRLPRASRRAALLAAVALIACGEPKTAPAPFAELAGEYQLETVNGAALPFAEGGNSWLFERRFLISGEGRYQELDVYCVVNGERCPRRERARSGRLYRSDDGSLWFEYGTYYSAPATFEATGRLEIAVTDALSSGPGRTTTYRYQRQ